MKNIGIIGSGSFGCALAYTFSKRNNIKIWSYTKEETDSINNNHCCLLQPSIVLNDKIKCFQDYEEVIKDSDIIILVSPSNVFRKTCQDIKKYITNQDIVIASKGMENDKLLSMVVEEELGFSPSIISGPSFAFELATDEAVFVDYAGNKEILNDLENDNFRLFYQEDIIGVQIGAALKNVIALAIGIAEGVGYKNSAISYLVSKGLEEIKDIGVSLGASWKTFYGLSGLGDLLTTSYGDNSRNKRAGVLLGKGYTKEEVSKEIGMVMEGFESLINAKSIISKYQLSCPMINNLYETVYHGRDVRDIIKF